MVFLKDSKRQAFVILAIAASFTLLMFQNCGGPSHEGLLIEFSSEQPSEEQLNSQFDQFQNLANEGELDLTRARLAEYIINPPMNQNIQDYSEESLKPVFRYFYFQTGRFVFGNSQYLARDQKIADEVLFEGIAFNLFYRQLEDSRRLYLCLDTEANSHYLSTDELCEPNPERSFVKNKGALGFIASQYTNGARARLIRCYNKKNQSYLTTLYSSECDEALGYEIEGVLGYVSENQKGNLEQHDYRDHELNRYKSIQGSSYYLSVDGEAEGWEKVESYSISIFNLGNMLTLYSCYDNLQFNRFESTDPQCEINSAHQIGAFKYLSRIKTRDFDRALYRCKSSEQKKYFSTTDFDCEGYPHYSAEKILGFVGR